MRLVTVAAVASLLLVAGGALGEPTAADKETARRLMSEGRAHRKDAEWKAAYQSFLAADAIMHVPTTGLEVARAQVQLGQLVEARDRFLDVARLPAAPGEPRAFTEARATAKILSAEIEPRIPSITIKLPGTAPGSASTGAPDATLTVTVDGVELPAAALTAPRAVDPGHHVVVLQTANGERRQSSVDVKESETKEVDLEAPTSPEAPAPEETPAPPAATPAGGSGGWKIVTFTGFGVGAAGLILGSVTGILAISDFNSAKSKGCVGNMCPPSAYPELDQANTMATLSTVGFIVGGVGAAGGFLGFFMGRKGSKPASSSTGMSLDLGGGPGSPASAMVRGSF